jgi:hypothetical protein
MTATDNLMLIMLQIGIYGTPIALVTVLLFKAAAALSKGDGGGYEKIAQAGKYAGCFSLFCLFGFVGGCLLLPGKP